MKPKRYFTKKLFLKNFRDHYRWTNGNRSELKKIVVTLQCVLIAVMVAALFTLIDAAFGLVSNAIADFALLISFLSAYHLINRNRSSLGKLLIFAAANGVLFLNGSSQGRDAGNFYLCFPIITGIFALFSSREYRYVVICMGMTLSNFVILEITDYTLLQNTPLPPSYTYVNYLVSFIISTMLVGYFSYFYSKANNITEKKLQKMNARLRNQNQRLTKTNGELDAFVYKASHDLRAPLSSILGLIDISRMENDLEKLKSYSQMQEKLIRKLDLYIMDILAISRNSNLGLQTEEIDVRLLMEQALDQLKFLENYPRIEKTILVPEAAVPFYSDQKRISIIVNNLLSNAIRYADLSKENPFLRVQVTFTSEEAVIELLDNGIGIGKAHLGKIFNMFYRATDKNSGSGLGLYIVQETVEKLQGKIQVTSEAGKWARFEIRLPNMQAPDFLPPLVPPAQEAARARLSRSV